MRYSVPVLLLSLLSGFACAADRTDDIAGSYPELLDTADSSAAAMLAGDQPALLDAAIARYEAIASDGGWAAIDVRDDGPGLKPGARDARVRLLRQRLRLSGDYQADMGADPLVFDAALYDALIAFQNRHGLYPNGAVAGQTLELLNLPVEQRVAQLQQAQDAWRALPAAGKTGRRIWVNIPEAVVSALNNGRIEFQLRAVVGHATRPTPELSSTITRVVVNPAWNVPQSIAGEDILPRQLDNPAYLSENGFRVFGSWTDDTSEMNPELIAWQLIKADRFPYRLRQEPGPSNSLGRFKFDFPNSFDVYMHDTPSRLLLDLSVRSLSAGCVRVDEPALLAEWLSSPNPVLSNMIQTAAEDPAYATRTFALPQSVPLDFVYLSAWVAPDGRTHFRRDVYGRTASIAAAR